MCRITLMPAYSRKYDTYLELLSDWNAGLDFHIVGGPYCSIRDLESMKRDLGADIIEFTWFSGDDGLAPNNRVYWQSEMAKYVATDYV